MEIYNLDKYGSYGNRKEDKEKRTCSFKTTLGDVSGIGDWHPSHMDISCSVSFLPLWNVNPLKIRTESILLTLYYQGLIHK